MLRLVEPDDVANCEKLDCHVPPGNNTPNGRLRFSFNPASISGATKLDHALCGMLLARSRSVMCCG